MIVAASKTSPGRMNRSLRIWLSRVSLWMALTFRSPHRSVSRSKTLLRTMTTCPIVFPSYRLKYSISFRAASSSACRSRLGAEIVFCISRDNPLLFFSSATVSAAAGISVPLFARACGQNSRIANMIGASFPIGRNLHFKDNVNSTQNGYGTGSDSLLCP